MSASKLHGAVSVVVGFFRRRIQRYKLLISLAALIGEPDGTSQTSTPLAQSVTEPLKQVSLTGTLTGKRSSSAKRVLGNYGIEPTALVSIPPLNSGLYSKKSATKQNKQLRKSHHKQYMLLVIHRDGYVCNSCGVDGRRIKLTLDHVKPLSQGGAHKPHNLQLLCPMCHRHKDHLDDAAKKRENIDRVNYLLSSDEEKERMHKMRKANVKRKYLTLRLAKLRRDDPYREKLEAKIKELDTL